MDVRHDRVRGHTAAAVLQRIDDATAASLERCARAGRAETDQRLAELDREWNTDRVIELEAALTALAGLAAGVLARAGFLAVPAVAAAALLVHATQGPYPLLPVLRRLGVRTAREIARERYALKALRGDFHAIGDAVPAAVAAAAVRPAEDRRRPESVGERATSTDARTPPPTPELRRDVH